MADDFNARSRSDGQLRSELLELIEHVPQLLRVLDYVDVYSETGNQRLVSDRRNVVPSSVSSAFKNLEAALDLTSSSDPDSGKSRRHQLRGLIGSGEATEFMTQVQILLEAGEGLVRAANRLRERQTLLVGCFNPHIKSFVADAAALFHREQDDFRLQFPRAMGGFRRVNFGDMKDELCAGQSDYIVASVPHASPGRQIEMQRIYRFNMVVVTPPGHPFANQTTVTGSDLAKQELPVLLGPEGYLSRSVVKEIFSAAGKPLRLGMENPDSNTRAALARSGYGITVVHDDSIDPELWDDYPCLKDDCVETGGDVVVAWRANDRAFGGPVVAREQHEHLIHCLRRSAANSKYVRDQDDDLLALKASP